MTTAEYTVTREDLKSFRPRHTSFVGVDSDGCVFDTMEIKQKQCFHGQIIARWGLERIEPLLRECAEFVNLYSRWRGQNRFTALLMTFDLLRARPEVRSSGVVVPQLLSLRQLADSGSALSDLTLAEASRKSDDRELAAVLDWSRDVDRNIKQVARHAPPFRWARRSLSRMREHSDVICVSQTPGHALVREWRQHDLARYVSLIAAQELGTKSEHIDLAARGRYHPSRILVIGDGPGDMQAASEHGALFYPINPGREEESWKRFCFEAYGKFLAGSYAGSYENKRKREFEDLLPQTPPWARAGLEADH